MPTHCHPNCRNVCQHETLASQISQGLANCTVKFRWDHGTNTAAEGGRFLLVNVRGVLVARNLGSLDCYCKISPRLSVTSSQSLKHRHWCHWCQQQRILNFRLKSNELKSYMRVGAVRDTKCTWIIQVNFYAWSFIKSRLFQVAWNLCNLWSWKHTCPFRAGCHLIQCI